MFPQTTGLQNDGGTSEAVNPWAEFADSVDGVFVVQETIFFI